MLIKIAATIAINTDQITSITQETMPDGTHSCFVRMSDDNAHVIAGNVDDVCKRLGVTVTAIGPLPPAKRTGKG